MRWRNKADQDLLAHQPRARHVGCVGNRRMVFPAFFCSMRSSDQLNSSPSKKSKHISSIHFGCLIAIAFSNQNNSAILF